MNASLKPPFTLQDAGNEGWFGANASRLRALPLVAGASGIVGVLLNRILSGVRARFTCICGKM